MTEPTTRITNKTSHPHGGMYLMSTPAHAARNTKSTKPGSATGKPARPPKNLAIPAAASPKRRLKMEATPADTGRAATK